MNQMRLSWGILGTGHIAGVFAEGLAGAQRGMLAAIGSRNSASAQQFARQYSITNVHGSYEDLLGDPAVEAVYISLPNSMHHEWTLKALRAGKHVLCEKPLATHVTQAREMFEVAKTARRVLVEAFMYRSHPMTHALQKVVREGAIGQVKIIRTSFVYATSQIAGNVRFSRELAGGALMDIGCYCTSYSRLFAGAAPTAMQVYGHLHAARVDDYVVGVMKFPADVMAEFACGMTLCADNTAYLLGTEGYIEVPMPWKPPVTDAMFTIVNRRGERHIERVNAGKHLYALEADDFAATVFDGAPPAFSEADSMGNQSCMDEMRRQMDVSF